MRQLSFTVWDGMCAVHKLKADSESRQSRAEQSGINEMDGLAEIVKNGGLGWVGLGSVGWPYGVWCMVYGDGARSSLSQRGCRVGRPEGEPPGATVTRVGEEPMGVELTPS
jgi:hypothetical protein